MSSVFRTEQSQGVQPIYTLGGHKVADPDWCFKDKEGHAHFWCKGTDGTDGGWILPSLNKLEEIDTYWCEDCCDEHEDVTVTYECKQCGELVKLGYKVDRGPIYMYTGNGQTTYYIDDQMVRREEFMSRMKEEGILTDGL
jgi:hypothetical protein